MEKEKSDSSESSKDKLANAIINASDRIDAAYARLAKVEKQLNLGTTAAYTDSSDSSTLASAFEALLGTGFAKMFESAHDIGGPLEKAVDLVGTLANLTRSYLAAASLSKRPSDADYEVLIAPFVSASKDLSDLAAKSKVASLKDHLAMLTSSLAALTWPIQSAPGTAVEKAVKDSESFARAVLAAEKNNTAHEEFVTSYRAYIKAVRSFVTKNCTSGVQWNSQGGNPPKTLDYFTRGVIVAYPSRASTIEDEDDRVSVVSQDGAKDLSVDAAKKKSVSLISCLHSTILIKGRPDRVLLDGCRYSTVTLDESGPVTVLNSVGLKLRIKGLVGDVLVASSYNVRLAVVEGVAVPAMSATASSDIKISVFEGGNKVDYHVPTAVKVAFSGGAFTSSVV